ncbi:MAG: polynucleotide adenylyltransferase [Candidatus Adlerbacteria bacterium]|nr:polynucleotide adenylyltransferase [Candidatus Adlerbacteria bacterium]
MELKPSLIPTEVRQVVEGLEGAGHEAYIVGGCVRDLLLGREPKDWDVTTNATPEAIQSLFEETYYTNEFGTVGVVNAAVSDERLKVIEVTPYRLEGRYSDSRRPDSVIFSQDIADDLKRRDFTINALAYSLSQDKLIDLYDGIKDIKAKILRAVGEPKARFEEDALRLMRAIRIAAELGFAIEGHTLAAIGETAGQLGKISKERIQAEFIRIINSQKPMDALVLCQKLGLLTHIVPELEEGIGCDQNQAHSYDVFEHNMRSLQHAADKGWPFSVRLAALFHDIGKPKSRRWDEGKKDWTFHGHDVIGARMTRKILENLKFSRETIEETANLVRWHMFFSDPEKITLSAVRRIIRNVGPEHVDELIQLRICDRIGTGRPKEQPFRLRKYQAMIDEARRDPISVSMLKIDGKRLMEVTRETPGPKFGWTLHALLEEVLDDPKRNTAEYLENRARELMQLSEEDLKALGAEGKEKKEEVEAAEIKDIHKKHFVD